MLKFTRLLGAIALLLPTFGCSEPGGPLNIVFILVDDLGWKDIGVNGSSFYETPHIDRLVARGVRFSNAYASSPVCSAPPCLFAIPIGSRSIQEFARVG